MLSNAASLSRLRLYADICRRKAAAENARVTKEEFTKLSDNFHRAAAEAQVALDVENGRQG